MDIPCFGETKTWSCWSSYGRNVLQIILQKGRTKQNGRSYDSRNPANSIGTVMFVSIGDGVERCHRDTPSNSVSAKDGSLEAGDADSKGRRRSRRRCLECTGSSSRCYSCGSEALQIDGARFGIWVSISNSHDCINSVGSWHIPFSAR
jgi:hypothetical protein